MHHHKWGSFRGAIALGLLAVGCPQPADLENPDAYNKTPPNGAGGTAGNGQSGGAGGGGAPPNCEVACVNTIFSSIQANGCKACHAGVAKLGGLDLSVPGYTARLKDQKAKHLDGDPNLTGQEQPLPPSANCPQSDSLIDTSDPSKSWLWRKLNQDQDLCGSFMPIGKVLPASDLACIKGYIECVAQKPIGGSGGAGGATAGTGGGGTGGGGTGGGGTGGT